MHVHIHRTKKCFHKNFAEFKGKHLHQSLFFSKVASLRPATLLTKRLWHRCFSVNFAKFLGKPFLTQHLQFIYKVLMKCNFQNH